LFDVQKLDGLLADLSEQAPVPEAVKSYARPEYARGMQFHFDYVARLGMSGRRVLDAGCGVGNWSLALAEHFGHVTSLEFNPDRLAFTRLAGEAAGVGLDLVHGSIEDLPFSDACFDGVFCNGVIFLTDYRQSMAELARVLKPGGMLYVSFDELAWWDHLILDRGPTEPQLLPMSCGMLVNHVADLLQAFALTDAGRTTSGKLFLVSAAVLGTLRSAIAQQKRVLHQLESLWMLRKPLWQILRRGQESIEEVRSHMHQLSASGRFFKSIVDSCERVFRFGTKEQRTVVSQDLLSFVQGKNILSTPRRGYCINREDMRDVAGGLGLDVIGLSAEGAVIVNPERPIAGGVYPTNWGVAEMLARKPDGQCAWMTSVYCRATGRAALSRFSSLIHDPVVTNTPVESAIGTAFWRHYRSALRRIDRSTVFENLIGEVCRGTASDEESFRSIYRFVQDAIFHHPLVQLVDEYGNTRQVSSLETLAAGIGRCGHAARVTCDLFQMAGYQARVTQLHKHVCCEVLFDGRWRVVDADAFKAGIRTTNDDGDWATLDELRAKPVLIDRVPAIGLQLAPYAAWSRGIGGLSVSGYTDVGLAWHRPYVSYLYFGGAPRRPPPPPSINYKRYLDRVVLKAEAVAVGVQRVRVAVGTRSRGWTYGDFPDDAYLEASDDSTASLELAPEDICKGVSIQVPPITLYVNVSSLDEYQMSNQPIWVWPGDELTIPFSEGTTL
jgi:SAM-dependent methyltransferase